MMDWDGNMSTAGWLLMTGFWVALLGTIIWAVVSLPPPRRAGSEGRSARPEDVLARRLAAGEIDSATYDELRAKLRAAPAERV